MMHRRVEDWLVVSRISNGMMERTTARNSSQSMVYSKDMDLALAALQNGGLILLPTDTVWSLAALVCFPEAVSRLKQLSFSLEENPLELLVGSVEELKRHVVHMHPRLETLLLYHMRPLSIVFEDPIGVPANALWQDGRMAMRIVLDPFVRDLIELAGLPLVATPAPAPNRQVSGHFGGISSEVLQQTDYVVKYRQGERQIGELPVMVQLSEEEELDFLRE